MCVIQQHKCVKKYNIFPLIQTRKTNVEYLYKDLNIVLQHMRSEMKQTVTLKFWFSALTWGVYIQDNRLGNTKMWAPNLAVLFNIWLPTLPGLYCSCQFLLGLGAFCFQYGIQQ